MRRWQPLSGAGRWVALALLLILLGVTVFDGLQIARVFAAPPENWPVNLGLYARVVIFLALLLCCAALTYRVAAAFTLSYDLDRNGLYINWLGNRAVVPLEKISHLDVGLGDMGKGWGPVHAIGYYSGQQWLADGRSIHRFSTLPNDRSLVVHTAEAIYAISPKDTDAFVQDLEQRRNLGAAKTLSTAVEPGRMFLYAFWHDTTVRGLLIAAFAINLVVLGLLAARYPELASSVEMRFNAVGQAAELRPRHDLLFLPMAAFLLSLVNTGLGLLLYRRQKLGARLLQGASVVVQLMFSVAVLTIIH